MSRINWLAVAFFCFAGNAYAAISPFEVMEKAGDFELIENTTRTTTLAAGTTKRCFIRSRFDSAAPTVFIYPATQKWNLQLPDDAFTAAEWEDRNIGSLYYRGLPVYFKVSIDEGKAIETTVHVKNVNPHKKRYINFPSPDAETVYAFLQTANTLEIHWKHEGLGSLVDKNIRYGIGKEVPLGQARYDASGIPALMQSYKERCTR